MLNRLTQKPVTYKQNTNNKHRSQLEKQHFRKKAQRKYHTFLILGNDEMILLSENEN